MEVSSVARSRKPSPLVGEHTKQNGIAVHSSKAQPYPANHQDDDALLTWDEILPWQKDNRFITSHYRPASFSFIRSAKSLGWLHNQTVNIYTHLIGAIFFVASAMWFHRQLATRYQSASKTDIFVFDVFFPWHDTMPCILHELSYPHQSLNGSGQVVTFLRHDRHFVSAASAVNF